MDLDAFFADDKRVEMHQILVLHNALNAKVAEGLRAAWTSCPQKLTAQNPDAFVSCQLQGDRAAAALAETKKKYLERYDSIEVS